MGKISYKLNRPLHQQPFNMVDLNPEQARAVMHSNGPLLVLAGAGSGKTKTLVYRLVRLVQDGIPPNRILLLTFTRKSSQEMMRRSVSLLDSRCQQVVGGTFHSFCNDILHRHATAIGYTNGFTIMDRSDAQQLMSMIRTQGQYYKKDKRFPRKDTLINIASKAINTNQSIEHVVAGEFCHFYDLTTDIIDVITAYHRQKRALSVMDYDDLLVNMVTLLTNHPDIRDQLSTQYQHIMVDEFQDTNHIQLSILKCLTAMHQNIMVVGDDAQSIYSFRGADIQNILTFHEQYPHVTTIQLNTNYRSSQPILNVSNAVINGATDLYAKHLTSSRTSTHPPVLVEVFNDREQADFIVDRVLALRDEGVLLRDMAVLFRSGSHSINVELALTTASIPFKKFGGIKFTDAAHIKDVVAMLKVKVNPNDDLSWFRIFQLLDGVGPKLAQSIIEYQKSCQFAFDQMDYAPFNKKSAIQMIRDIAAFVRMDVGSPTDALERAIALYKPLMAATYDDARRRDQDLQSFISVSKRFDAISALLDTVSLDPPESNNVATDDMDDEWMTLSTIHSAKGLEWSRVFVLSVVDGQLPSFRSFNDADQLEEERRLLYVAMTRAKDDLYLMKPMVDEGHANSYSGGMGYTVLSRFITQDMVEKHCDIWTLTPSDDSSNDSSGMYSF